MSTTETLTKLFDIEGCKLETYQTEEKNGVEYTVLNWKYDGKEPTVCPECGAKLYKHTAQKLNITDTPMLGKPLKCVVTIPRKRCSECNYLWRASLPGIDEKHKLTKRAYENIAEKALRQVFQDVGDEYLLANNTIKNIMIDFLEERRNQLRFKTPIFLGIDEIKLGKLGEVTVITDLEHHTIYDLLHGRNQEKLIEYFKDMPSRENVLWVCSDMYRPFEKTIGMTMPNAKWVIDHFHVVMKANEAVDDVRKTIQSKMSKKDRIKTKKGLSYALRTRAKDLTPYDASKIRSARSDKELAPIAIAFDLKEDFFNIYDENPTSVDDAKKAFAKWETSIPADSIYEKFRELANTVHNNYDQIFRYWECPVAISNGYTECANRLIRENNVKGRGYSFEILRGRTLYRNSNIKKIEESGMMLGPIIPDHGPVFHYEAADSDESYDIDLETGEILE